MRSLAINNGISAYLKDINSIPLLSKTEEYDLAVKYYEEKDLQAANALVVSNLRFVVKIANEYGSYGFPIMDLIQEGSIGLMQAVKKFDPYRGYRLISYAVWWIRARIHNHIMKFWSTVKIGTTQTQRKLFHKISNAKRKLGITDDSDAKKNLEILADHFDVDKVEIQDMELRLASRDFSLDAFKDSTENVKFVDLLDDHGKNQEEMISEHEINELRSDALKSGLEILNEREKYIVVSRYLSSQPMKLKELGEKYGISKERVRQIEAGAINKLKKHINDKLNYENQIRV